MSNLMWKARQAISNLIPVAIIGAIAFGGWHFYKKGTFRNGIAPVVSSVLHKIPYFGSRFRHYSPSGGSSYARSSGTVRRSHSKRHHGRRHHGRTRRHRR